jgi:uncharacterized ferritin-like protein (DUF455 family)
MTTSLEEKLVPPPPPTTWLDTPRVWPITHPGRPPELRPRVDRKKTPKLNALRHESKRAQVLHTFLHHELQAAELMAWAILSFPETPIAFRRGLLKICQDEIRHLQMYRRHLRTLDCDFGSQPVHDFIWERVAPGAFSPAHFVARLGIGFEGGNLDHGARFARAFESAGDSEAARIQALITHEEISHAAFAIHWFEVFAGTLEFPAWRQHLPARISSTMMRGHSMSLGARHTAGFTPDFLESLALWNSDSDLP